MADEFTLTHKVAYQTPAPRPVHPRSPPSTSNLSNRTSSTPKEERECFYCHKLGHVIANCQALKRKEQTHSASSGHTKGVGLTKGIPATIRPRQNRSQLDSCFQPFIFDGAVSLPDNPADARPIRILRDTGGSQSLILAGALPFSEKSACGYNVILSGVEMGYVPHPLHKAHIQTELVSGVFPITVCPALPISGVTMLLGNDIAGGRVVPSLEVLDTASCVPCPPDVPPSEMGSPSCVSTRAQSLKRAHEGKSRDQSFVDLNNTLFSSLFAGDQMSAHVSESPASETAVKAPFPCSTENSVTWESLIAAQRADPTLKKCFACAEGNSLRSSSPVEFFIKDGVLIRRWSPKSGGEFDWGTVEQIVTPAAYRHRILTLAHESAWAGHFGVNKTYELTLRHFFWPGQKSNVVEHCHTCHACQVVGKPNQVIPPAPLRPIPALGEPFERVLVDCVGPLPRTNSGHQYLLTIMCATTNHRRRCNTGTNKIFHHFQVAENSSN